MVRHVKTHDGVKFPCNLCTILFTYKHNHDMHVKTVHREVRVVPDGKKTADGPSITPLYDETGSSNTEDALLNEAYDKAMGSYGKIFLITFPA